MDDGLYLRQMLQKRDVQLGIGREVIGDVKTCVLSERAWNRNGYWPRLVIKREEVLDQGIPVASGDAT